MVGNKNIRSYEVSIWTLQDSFITVLKPLNLEYKGLMQDGKITLQDDGENRISFSIPMYITKNGEFVENPLWYSKKEGYLIANLRKLKVIFNKKTEDEMVFEFLITKVTESHEGFEKTCFVEGEGLAFNELGKQGYKISLSAEDLAIEIEDKINELNKNVKPSTSIPINEIYIKNNINYWVDKVLEGTNWRYSIQMDWSITDGIIDETYTQYNKTYEDLTDEERENLNNNRARAGLRRHDCIYEDTYVSSWDIVNNSLIPKNTVDMMEKLRIIDSNDSNRYNLIQTIAKTFEVYTKFKYYYDDNYHIIDREIIFYNNFLNENNFIDLNYSYDTKSISRELDAVDVVTKMYVKSLDDETYPSGSASIADTEANKTREDYLLNFDYLYSIKTINDEQYAAIKDFEKNIANLNKDIIQLDNEIINLNQKILDAEIARDSAKVMAQEAQENITYINDQIKQIYDTYKDNSGNTKTEWEVTRSNPAFVFVSKNLKNNAEYVGSFSSQYSGINANSILIYSDRNNPDSSKIKFTKIVSTDGDISLNFGRITPPVNGYFYATFSYKPALKNEKLREKYETLYQSSNKKYNTKVNELGRKLDDNGKEIKIGTGLKDTLETKEKNRKVLYEQKKTLISNFENLMGPALREGNWQPEDEYSNYGDQYDETIVPSYSISTINSDKKLNFIWDKELFDEEETNYYESGINQDKIYYPCIDLTKINSAFIDKLKVEELRNQLTLVYKVKDNSNPYLFPQGTSCRFAFIQKAGSNADVIPVLMLTNLDYEVNIPADITNAYLSFDVVDVLLNDNITVDNDKVFLIPKSGQNNAWITNLNLYDIIYPRLQFDVENLRVGEGDLFLNIYREKETSGIKYYSYIEKLEEFSDYYIMSRENKKYITIKPEVLIAGKVGEAKIKVNYSVSNTALQIYLDAIKVMKENAYPKVSYTVNNILSQKLLHDTYNRLGQLAHINDAELKFQNVMGYISAVELNLDKPWEDTITIQNYKTKFEDLFSTIVAQTEEMKKNAAKFNVAANAFSSNGMLIAPFAQESLLKSPQVLNNLIKNNADIIATRAVGQAASDKAALAMTKIYSVMNGNTGIAFTGNNIDSVALNQDDGLVIAGKTKYKVGNADVLKSVFFKLDNVNMGFFEGEVGDYSKPQLYYDNGNLALSGTIYAGHGWFGGEDGWIIGSNKLSSNNTTGLGGLLYSANGKAIFTSKGGGSNKTDPMIILTKTGFSLDQQNAALLFDGTNLYISGTISALDGNVGGWHIGDSYLGNNTTQLNSTVGMASGKDNSEQSQKYSFWAGGAYSGSSMPLFYVTPAGYLYSTSGSIGGWTINNSSISKQASLGIQGSEKTYQIYISSNLYNKDLETNGIPYNPVFCVRNVTDNKYPFYVRSNGILHAEGADISGKITATSGSIGGWILNTAGLWSPLPTGYSSTNPNSSESQTALQNGKRHRILSTYSNSTDYILSIGANYTLDSDTGKYTTNASFGSAPFRVNAAGKLYATGADISGTIHATAGRIGGTYSNNTWSGGWVISSTHIGDNDVREESKVGISTAGTVRFWAGASGIPSSETNGINLKTTNFYVLDTGKLYANDAEIEGIIKADTGYIGGSSGWTIKSQQIYSGTAEAVSDNSITLSTKNIPKTINGSALTNLRLIIGSHFGVTATGALYASNAVLSGSLTAGENFSVTNTGVITAKNGSIGGWNIGPDYIGNGKSRRGENDFSTVGMSSGTGSQFVFWAGGRLQDGSDPISSIPFYVRANGTFYANKGYIGGWKITTNGIYSEKIGSTTSGWRHSLLQTTSPNGLALVIAAPLTGVTFNDKMEITGATYDNNSAPFKVTNEGKLYATNAELSAATITGETTINTSGSICFTGGNTYLQMNKDTFITFIGAAGETVSSAIEMIKNKIDLSTTKLSIECSSAEIYNSNNTGIEINSTETSITTNRFSFVGQGDSTNIYSALTRVYIGTTKPDPNHTLGKATAILWIKPTSTVFDTGKVTFENKTYNFNWYKCEFYYAQPYENTGNVG